MASAGTASVGGQLDVELDVDEHARLEREARVVGLQPDLQGASCLVERSARARLTVASSAAILSCGGDPGLRTRRRMNGAWFS